ncbi:MAG: hypothetical protein LBF59_02025, partial [Prevotellaceae bacterium]|nr:hypothetical protein [Prevotellaceae bacterium]
MKKFLTLCVFASLFTACVEKVPVEVTNLRCENLSNPVIDISNPRLSWEILSDGRDIRQKFYWVLV